MRAFHRSVLVVSFALCAVPYTTPAYAGIIASAGIDSSLVQLGAETDGDPAFDTATQGGARASASGQFLSSAFTYTGTHGCGPGMGLCATLGLEPSAYAAAHVHTGEARLRSVARTSPGAVRAIAVAALVDTLTFDEPITFDIDFDLNELEILDDSSSASVYFALGLEPENDETFTALFGIEAYLDLNGRTGEDTHTHFIVSPQDFFPFPLPPGTEITRTFRMVLGAEILGRGAAAADQSVTVGITGAYTSANGYSYPGQASNGEVPEPGTSWLAVSGLAVVTWARHRLTGRRRNAPLPRGRA